MARVLGLDFETTGLDLKNDRVTEIGYVLWDTEEKKPLQIVNKFLWDFAYPPITEEITRLTGITQDLLTEFGVEPRSVWDGLAEFCGTTKVEYIVGHNGENFDKPFLLAELDRAGLQHAYLRGLPWIDTRTDLPFLQEPDSRKLRHLALDAGFINFFEHRAVFDVLTMLRVMGHYDFATIVEESKIPFVTVRAMVSYEDRELAKAQRFSWEKCGDKTYNKQWVKRIKLNKLDAEKAKCNFQLVQLND